MVAIPGDLKLSIFQWNSDFFNPSREMNIGYRNQKFKKIIIVFELVSANPKVMTSCLSFSEV